MALRTLENTVLRTPVDTGTLQGAWELSEITWFSDYAAVLLKNNVDYASYVEYGHRTRSGGFVPPVFMAKYSIEEIQAQFEKIYDRLFLLAFSDVL